MRKIWFDTEFIEYTSRLQDGSEKHILDPISIGCVDDKGRTFEAVFQDFNKAAAEGNGWVKENVLAKLPPEDAWETRENIRQGLLKYIGDEKCVFYYWFAPQDAVILMSKLATRFLDFPKNMHGYPINIAQKFEDAGSPYHLWPFKANRHEALADATWARDFDRAIDNYITGNSVQYSVPGNRP